jgi:hypothetical protein
MLPGFRFLFAAIVLSMSILVFGLGAAALLRAAHEQFASNTSLRAAPETTFAQPSEPTKPVLAVLRVEPPAPAIKPNAVDPQAAPAPADTPATSAPAEPESIVSTSPEPEKTAALSAPEASPSASPPEPVTAEAAAGLDYTATEVPAAATAAAPIANKPSPAPADAAATDTATANEAKVAATGQPSPPAVAAEPTSVPAGTDADDAAAKSATLDGPSLTIETHAPEKAERAEIKAAEIKTSQPDKDEIKKRLRAERARERRRLAARQQARQQAALAQQQQAANPFAQQPPAAAQQQAASRYQPTQAARTP